LRFHIVCVFCATMAATVPEVIDLDADDDEVEEGSTSHAVPRQPAKDREYRRLQAFAQGWRGQCLSASAAENNMWRWRCSRGHEWEASAEQVTLERMWCPRWVCQRGQHPLKAQQAPPVRQLWQLAAAGRCALVDPTESTTDPTVAMRWRCANGCLFSSTLSELSKVPGWCPMCDEFRRKAMHQMSDYASRRGGVCHEAPTGDLRWFRCLDDAVIRICCERKHVFGLTSPQMGMGQWCSQCPPPAPPPVAAAGAGPSAARERGSPYPAFTAASLAAEYAA